jgi:hypothetical protein
MLGKSTSWQTAFAARAHVSAEHSANFADGAEHLIPTEMASLVKINRDLPNLLGTSQQK